MHSVKKILRRISTYMLILLTCLALAFGLPMIPNPRYTFHDREVKTEQVERKEDEESYEESEQRE